MTLVFDRSAEIEGAQMHALVIGAGRFPYFGNGQEANVQACYDSAVAVIDFLLTHKDRLEPPLATIDCLLGDPSVDPKTAQDVMPARPSDIPQAVPVGRPVESEVRAIFDDLLARFRPGDSAFLYFCSHGVAGREESGLLLLEDIHSHRGNPWLQLLDVKLIAQNLPARLKADNVWLFMDACQERIEDLVDQVGGATGLEVVTVSSREVVRHKGKSLALAAARFGTTTQAPAGGGVAYFTKALIDGLTNCCVDRRQGKWRISSKQLQSELGTVARAAGYPPIEVTPLVASGQTRFLMTIDQPSIPVYIYSRPESLLRNALSAIVRDCATGQNRSTASPEWRFRVPPEPDEYEIEVITDRTTLTGLLEIVPPAVEWEIRDE